MFRLRARFSVSAVLIILMVPSFIWSPPDVMAQEAAIATAAVVSGDGSSASKEAPSKSKPDFVPMPDIGVRSEQAKQRLKEALRVTTRGEEEFRAKEAIPQLRDWVNRESEQSSKVRAVRHVLLSLDQVQAGWAQVERRLEETQQGLQDQGEKVEGQVELIRKINTLWSNTRARAVELGVAPDVIRQIDEVLKAASSTSKTVNERQAQLLALQSSVASLTEIAESDEKLIADARNQAGRRLNRADRAECVCDAGFSPRGAAAPDGRTAPASNDALACVDETLPVLMLKGPKVMRLRQCDTYEERGVEIRDENAEDYERRYGLPGINDAEPQQQQQQQQ